MRDYKYSEGEIIAKEMMDQLCLDMAAKKLATDSVSLYVGYSYTEGVPGAGGTAKLGMESNTATMLVSAARAPMPPSRWAKQFAPFQALNGLNEAIAAKEKRPEPRRELSEYMKDLLDLQKGQQITGTVVKVDAYWKTLQVNKVVIDFSEIYEIIK